MIKPCPRVCMCVCVICGCLLKQQQKRNLRFDCSSFTILCAFFLVFVFVFLLLRASCRACSGQSINCILPKCFLYLCHFTFYIFSHSCSLLKNGRKVELRQAQQKTLQIEAQYSKTIWKKTWETKKVIQILSRIKLSSICFALDFLFKCRLFSPQSRSLCSPR